MRKISDHVETLPHIDVRYLHYVLLLLSCITADSLIVPCRLLVMGELAFRLKATNVERLRITRDEARFCTTLRFLHL